MLDATNILFVKGRLMESTNQNKWEEVIVAGKKCKIRYKHIISPEDYNEMNNVVRWIKELKDEINELAKSEKEITQLNLGYKLGDFYNSAKQIEYNLAKLLFVNGITSKTTPSLLVHYYDYKFEDGTLIDEETGELFTTNPRTQA